MTDWKRFWIAPKVLRRLLTVPSALSTRWIVSSAPSTVFTLAVVRLPEFVAAEVEANPRAPVASAPPSVMLLDEINFSAPLATEAKVPMVVMAAATAIIPTKSPMIVRSGFNLPQVTGGIADWAAKNGVKRVVTMVTDYGPGLDAEKTFVARFKAAGGDVVESLRTPLRNPDYAPFLQRYTFMDRLRSPANSKAVCTSSSP